MLTDHQIKFCARKLTKIMWIKYYSNLWLQWQSTWSTNQWFASLTQEKCALVVSCITANIFNNIKLENVSESPNELARMIVTSKQAMHNVLHNRHDRSSARFRHSAINLKPEAVIYRNKIQISKGSCRKFAHIYMKYVVLLLYQNRKH